jgi:pimeloyl-ACP methyl ester carboxylesterase
LFEENKINGWHFNWHINKPTVLVVHGFDSCCYKFETIIIGLLQHNLNVICFDAPAHGTSDGKTINSLQYARCIELVYTQKIAFNAILAHSLGGLATALFIEKTKANIPLALIAPSTNTYTAIDNFFKFLHVPQNLKPHFSTIIRDLSGKSVNHFNVARAIKDVSNSTLWMHDEDDFICPVSDVKSLIESHPVHIQFKITKGLGHNKIYRDKNVQQQLLNWLTQKLN